DEVEARPIALGQTLGGALSDDDGRNGSGRRIDRYAFTGRRGQRVDLRLNSEAFDPMLSIVGPNGFTMANDDSGDSLDSRILATLPADGAYRLQVTSYTRVAEGDYELIAGLNQSGEADTPIPVTTQARIGQVINGRLDRRDETQGEQFVERYSFAGRRGQPVTVDLSSADFDTVVTLTTPSGEQQLVDDTGDSLNSRLERVLDEDGTYGVMVSSYGEGATGAYRLALSEGTSRIPANPTPRRVFLVSVGISDYAGNTSNLDDTDHDAEKLAAKLEEQGLLAVESVVLTNQEATPEAFEARFREVAARAGPNDIFMFFYSGHGNQIDATADRRELDGQDETLVLADGSDYSDDRLAELLQGVNAGLSLIVLDSCFSGGFAQDVVTRPNVMGLFASEEDLTSLVAGDLGAGGYLARFFNDALGGSADGNGDRNVTAGELANYLRYRYRGTCAGAFCLPTETNDAQQGFQELIVQRGSVQIDDILFVLPRERRGVAD
ncbi:MAG: caspase family protein, partial [Sphingomonadaceae bacterium]|nr:caspase family protein [Sphingomonadaceae bacterium]